MKIESNIGILNALIRITFGLSILSWSTAKLAKKFYCRSYLLLAICGAMKVAEGIVRFCPIVFLIQKRQNTIPLQKKISPSDSQHAFSETVPIDPSQ